MTEAMLIYRLEDIAFTYWVKGILEPYGFITIVNEYPSQILTIPTVAVTNGKLIEEEFEMGNRDPGVRMRRWFISIFAKNISQRDDFAYRLLHESNNGINVYDYNEGFPPGASPSLINHLGMISRTYDPIDTLFAQNEKTYYRGKLTFVTKNDKV